eukprot:COSAG02_NODE_5071_length_4668_cov_3.398555_4_plen_187_part_00
MLPPAAASQPLAAMVRRVATSLSSDSSVSASLAGRILDAHRRVRPSSRNGSASRESGGERKGWAYRCSRTEWLPTPAPNSMTALPSSEDTSCLASASPTRRRTPPPPDREQPAAAAVQNRAGARQPYHSQSDAARRSKQSKDMRPDSQTEGGITRRAHNTASPAQRGALPHIPSSSPCGVGYQSPA